MNKVQYLVIAVTLVCGGCATPNQTYPFKAPPVAEEKEESAIKKEDDPLHLVNPNIGNHYFVIRAGQKIEVIQLDILTKLDDLPVSMRLRQHICAATEDEWQAENGPAERADFSLKFSFRFYQASDGVDFIIDHNCMALWFRHNKGPWVCLVSDADVMKTFGGNPARFPVYYAGDRRFLTVETIPGRAAPVTNDPFPRAKCATFLISGEVGELIARAPGIVYDHNPRLSIPEKWYTEYGFEFERIEEPSKK